MDDRTVVKNRSINLVLLVISGTAGIAALFLPFTENTSPIMAATEFCSLRAFYSGWWVYCPFAIPFCLSVLISAAYARWLITGALSKLERTFAYIASSITSIGLLCIEYLWLIDFDTKNLIDPFWWLFEPIGLLILFACVYVVIRNLKQKDSNAVIAMQLAYLINFYLCFVGFFEGLQIGAYCAAAASCVYLIQVTQPVLRPSIVQVKDSNS